jgi:hypothetical protein
MPAANPPITGAEFHAAFFQSLPHAPWREIMSRSAAQASGGSFWELRAYGWPYKCMAAGYLASPTGGKPIGLGWFDVKSPMSGRRILVPIRPIWQGLVADAVIFTVPWWAMAIAGGAGMRSFIQRMRRRRGRCPRCDYDLRGDPRGGCPECGWDRA